MLSDSDFITILKLFSGLIKVIFGKKKLALGEPCFYDFLHEFRSHIVWDWLFLLNRANLSWELYLIPCGFWFLWSAKLCKSNKYSSVNPSWGHFSLLRPSAETWAPLHTSATLCWELQLLLASCMVLSLSAVCRILYFPRSLSGFPSMHHSL